MIRHPCLNFKDFFFFQLKHSIQASNIQSDAGCAKETSWNTRRIETGGTISHGRLNEEIMLRLYCKERLDKVVGYDRCIDICTLPETRYALTHARENNHRLVSLRLWGVI